ncbi:hypothetical protein MUK51_00385 [Sphingobacterium faecium]|jgi:hypothetical protein|uniref:hypothetical protein n=1 Tax=Sphingobacterium faecium TaxID=34087 RepID=UPI0004E5FA25|nr:hypothetical protein [Sphingobacterium faecium]UXD69758.1 hypothetical protein MUK51_00385 [Sphingobacterium faecium]CDS91764.1 conserved hypothetical protein [Sphingobacterium sp. PM2-P1-29]
MNLKTTFIYIALGEKFAYHLQTIFSLLSLVKFRSEATKYIIYTDHPEYYKWLSALIEIRNIHIATFENWIGPTQYFYRTKIKAMQDAALKDDGHLIFLDSDTMAIGPLDQLIAQLSSGHNFLHLKERFLSDKQITNDHKRMWKIIGGTKINNILMDDTIRMWNSGIIALNQQDKIKLLDDVLLFNDTLCNQNIVCRVKEQFAFSVVLEKHGNLNVADSWILHYWGNKEEWHQKILDFLMPLLLAAHKPEDVADLIDTEEWIKTPYHRHISSFKKRLLKFCINKKDRTLTIE